MQVLERKISCPKCGSCNIGKNGLTNAKKQRLKCKDCQTSFCSEYKNKEKKVVIAKRVRTEKNCRKCGNTFVPRSYYQKNCDKCIIKTKTCVNYCRVCGRHLSGNWKGKSEEERVCEFCFRKGYGKKKNRDFLGEVVGIDDCELCPDCKQPLEKKRNGSGHGQKLSYHCNNPTCAVIRVRIQRGRITEIQRDSVMEKEVTV